MQMYGAILAVPNIRGGGEFGEEWHRGGRRENKASNEDFRTSRTVNHLVNRETVLMISLLRRTFSIHQFRTLMNGFGFHLKSISHQEQVCGPR